MNKKSLLLFVVLFVAVFALAGCTPATEEPVEEPVEEPAEDVAEEPAEEPAMDETDPYAAVDPTGAEVIFWHQHTQDREAALLEIVEEFNTTNEWGITVTAEYQGGYGDIFNKMLGVVATADAPELVVAYQNQAATYALVDDALIDMNLLVESPTWGLTEEEQADFFPGFYSQDIFPTFGNARYGFPPNRSEEMLYYNIDWLDELFAAGAIDFEGPPTTPEQFQSAACAAVENPFSAATGDPATSIGYELSVDASRFASWAFAFGGSVFDNDAGQYSLDNAGAVEAMTFLQGLFAEGCAKIVTENYGDQTNFGAATTLFTVGSSSGLPFYAQAVAEGANHQWSVAALPHTTPDPVQNIYGASVTIPTTTPEQELAAWLFIKYYTSPEIQGQWASVSQYFPVRVSAVEYLDEVFATVPGYQTAFELLEYGAVEPPVPGYDFVRTMMEESMAAIVGDPAMDVAGELATLTEDANAELVELLAE